MENLNNAKTKITFSPTKKKKVIIEEEEVFTGQENMKLKKIEETSCGIFSSFQNTDRVFIL